MAKGRVVQQFLDLGVELAPPQPIRKITAVPVRPRFHPKVLERERQLFAPANAGEAKAVLPSWADADAQGKPEVAETKLDSTFLHEIFGKALGYVGAVGAGTTQHVVVGHQCAMGARLGSQVLIATMVVVLLCEASCGTGLSAPKGSVTDSMAMKSDAECCETVEAVDCAGWQPGSCPPSQGKYCGPWPDHGDFCSNGSSCFALDACACLLSTACQYRGSCGFENGLCVPRNTQDCLKSVQCLEYALCSATDGFCVATDASCMANNELCKKAGWCHSVPPGFCAATTQADCVQSTGCKTEGACTLVQGRCCGTSGCTGPVAFHLPGR